MRTLLLLITLMFSSQLFSQVADFPIQGEFTVLNSETYLFNAIKIENKHLILLKGTQTLKDFNLKNSDQTTGYVFERKNSEGVIVEEIRVKYALNSNDIYSVSVETDHSFEKYLIKRK